MYITEGEVLTIEDIIKEAIHKAWESWDEGDDKYTVRYLNVIEEAVKVAESLRKAQEI